jgi:FKBP-type peptidyl-prolyl cis-trans isomerase
MFKVGSDEVVKGLDQGVQRMQVGERSMVTMTPAFGFGGVGVPNGCPPGAHLVFDVQLLGIVDDASADNAEAAANRHGSLPVNLLQGQERKRRTSTGGDFKGGTYDVLEEGGKAGDMHERQDDEEVEEGQAGASLSTDDLLAQFSQAQDAVQGGGGGEEDDEDKEDEAAEAGEHEEEEVEGGAAEGGAFTFASAQDLKDWVAENGKDDIDGSCLEDYLNDQVRPW